MDRLNESGELRKLVKPLQVIKDSCTIKYCLKSIFRTWLVFRLCVANMEGLVCFPAPAVMAARSLAGEALTA
jgi:hypothetical protein